jgi:phosphate-selective porin OprO/OprP
VSEAGPPPVSPVLAAEVDLAYSPREEEVESGFGVRRLLVGLDARPLPAVRAVAVLNPVGGEHDPLLWDAFIEGSHQGWTLTVGFGQSPLFASVQQPRDTNPVPELSLAARALWPGRDAGLQLHGAPMVAPVELWARVGNGSGSPTANDNSALSVDGRVDLVLGRGRAGAPADGPLGLRLGLGAHRERAEDRAGIAPILPNGFVPWRPPTVAGRVEVLEAHLVGLAGPVMLTVEGGLASEGRSADTDGDPETPRESLPTTGARAGVAELAWMLTGQRRLPGAWPVSGPRPGVELAGRVEAVAAGRGARDLEPGGVQGTELSARLWHPAGLSAALTGGQFQYDQAPLEEPGVTDSWFVALRASARLR